MKATAHNINAAQIERYQKEGHGRGEGVTYMPWIETTQVSGSQSYRHRIQGWKIPRVHHLLSDLERDVFLIMEWNENVFDIREQFPLLPIDETLEIAEELQLHHPVEPKTNNWLVMTTDLLITFRNAALGTSLKALCVKPESKLGNPIVIQKLEIERLYWQRRGIDWGIVTEKEIPMTVVRNLLQFHQSHRSEDLDLSVRDIEAITGELKKHLSKNTAVRHIALSCDQQLGYTPGTSLRVLRYLIATRQIAIDLNILFEPGNPLAMLDNC